MKNNTPTPKKKRVMGRSLKILAASALITAVSSGVAAAFVSNGDGAYAYNSGNTLTVVDSEDDGHAAYANWNGTGSNRIQTTGGSGSSESITVGNLVNYRACIDQGTFNPDNCSGYVQAP